MRTTTLALAAAIIASASAFVQNAPRSFVPTKQSAEVATTLHMAEQFDQEQFNAEGKEMRLKYLEEQAMYALKISCENYGNAVFPNAMIAGDVVITHLLDRLGYLKDGKCKIMVVDTFHLFPETMEFLKSIDLYKEDRLETWQYLMILLGFAFGLILLAFVAIRVEVRKKNN